MQKIQCDSPSLLSLEWLREEVGISGGDKHTINYADIDFGSSVRYYFSALQCI